MESDTLDLVTHPHGTLRLEYNEDVAILHLKRLEKLTPSVYRWGVKEITNIWKFLEVAGYSGIYAVVEADDKVINKILSRLNFKFKYTHTLEGTLRNVYERTE